MTYKLKELYELTEQDHEDIYRYAMQRSDEIVRGVGGGMDKEPKLSWIELPTGIWQTQLPAGYMSVAPDVVRGTGCLMTALGHGSPRNYPDLVTAQLAAEELAVRILQESLKILEPE